VAARIIGERGPAHLVQERQELRQCTMSSDPSPAATQRPMAITMGDACGIGPEIIAKLFRDPQSAGCVVLGDVGVMRRAAGLVAGSLAVARVEDAHDAAHVPPNCIPVIQVEGLPPDLLAAELGRVDARAGAAAARCIERSVELALAGHVAGIVTAPIHKEALAAAGVGYPGHTEMLQALCADAGQLPPVRMMLANEELRTVLVTIHMSLRRAIDAISFDSVLQTIRIAHRDAARWGTSAPRIAVAGLNPHAGEGGLFGDEEIRIIAPAIEAARSQGIDVRGPFAPDTVFMRARNAPDHPGEFDIVVAMTHDHGLIPVKYLGVEHGVNVTLGLPLLRTSPDHGTAFDIAGLGLADPSSLWAALRMARKLALATSVDAMPELAGLHP
jgi:4-hydroxythreonine-4-phosphate dehydrogenase